MGGEICGDSLVLSIFTIVNKILLIVKVVIPLIIIAMTTIDIVKDVTGGEVKYKTTLDRVKFRLLAAVLVFFMPNLIGVAFSIVDSDYSQNNLECLLHVTSADVKSALIAEIAELRDKIYQEENSGSSAEQTEIDEMTLRMAKLKKEDPEYYEKFKGDLSDINALREEKASIREQEMQDAIAKRNREKEAQILAENGIDINIGSSKSGVSLSEHDKPFTGAEIKYYTQSSNGPYGSIKYKYKGSKHTYNTSKCGCGFVSLSMIIDSLNGSSLTPIGIVQDFVPSVYASGNCPIYDATLLDDSGKINKDYGLEVKMLFHHGRYQGVQSPSVKNDYFNRITDALKNGYSIIMLIPHHFVVLGAIDTGGYVSFYDPANNSNNGWFTLDSIYNEHYNHGDYCVQEKTCGFVMAVAYKGPESISSIQEYNQKYNIKIGDRFYDKGIKQELK